MLENLRSISLKKLEDEDDVKVSGIEVYFYNSEEEAIEDFFTKTHNIDPDFILAWNQSFDAMTLQNRLKKLYSRKSDPLKEEYKTTRSNGNYLF